MRSRSGWLQAGQPRGVRGSQQPKTPACCPITSQESSEFEPLPHRSSHHGKETGKTVPPLAQIRGEAQQHIDQQRRPDLPADGVGAVPKEAAEFEGLLYLLEKHFDVPARGKDRTRLRRSRLCCW